MSAAKTSMSRSNFSRKLQRIIGQIRFRPTLPFFQGVPLAAKELEGKFEEWRASKDSDVVLYSPSQKKFMQITAGIITYVNEGKEDIDELKEYLKKIFEKSTDSFSISQIRRIGFRNTQVLESTFKFQELVDLIHRKFYSQSKEIKNISGKEPKDVVFVLDSIKNGFLNHVQIGPVRKEEALKYFNSSFESDIELSADNNLFVDTDVFLTENLEVENTLDKLDKAIQENLKIINEYISYLSS